MPQEFVSRRGVREVCCEGAGAGVCRLGRPASYSSGPGAGFQGCWHLCAVARFRQGLKVYMVTRSARLLSKLFTPELSDFYEREFERRGVTIVKNASVLNLVRAVDSDDRSALPTGPSAVRGTRSRDVKREVCGVRNPRDVPIFGGLGGGSFRVDVGGSRDPTAL